MPNVPNQATAIDDCTRRMNALARYADPSARIWIDGVEHTLAEVIAIYRRAVDARLAVGRKRAEIKDAQRARDQSEARRGVADRALRGWVRHRFGTSSKEAIDFGFPPPRVGVKSVEVKLRAVERAKATRAARWTMGERQRLAIRGVVQRTTSEAGDAIFASEALASRYGDTTSRSPP